jgi:hypothetical protein
MPRQNQYAVRIDLELTSERRRQLIGQNHSRDLIGKNDYLISVGGGRKFNALDDRLKSVELLYVRLEQ